MNFVLYSRIGLEAEVELHAELKLIAPASTIQNIHRAISERGWRLTCHLSAPVWRSGEVFVECCIQVSAPLMGRFPEIFSIVDNLYRASESVQGQQELVEAQKTRDLEEDTLDEGVCDGLEGWDD